MFVLFCYVLITFHTCRVGRGNKPTRGDRPTPIYSSSKDARDYLYCAIPSHHIGVTSIKSSISNGEGKNRLYMFRAVLMLIVADTFVSIKL